MAGTPTPSRGANAIRPPAPLQDDARKVLDSMVGSLVAGFTAPGVVRRRPSLRQLDAKLNEMRRRHGGKPR